MTTPSRLLSRAVAFVSIHAAEQFAGHLLVAAGRYRIRRMAPNDAHEARHLYAALNAGNSDPCGPNGADCHLDRGALNYYMDYIESATTRVAVKEGEPQP